MARIAMTAKIAEIEKSKTLKHGGTEKRRRNRTPSFSDHPILFLIYRWHGPQNVSRPRTLLHRIVMSNFAIAEYYRPLRKMRDVRFVRHQHNREPAVVQVLENL